MTPVRLNKKSTREDYRREINYWVTRNFGIIAIIAIVFLLIVFLMVCFTIVGVSAVESGAMRNFLNGGYV